MGGPQPRAKQTHSSYSLVCKQRLEKQGHRIKKGTNFHSRMGAGVNGKGTCEERPRGRVERDSHHITDGVKDNLGHGDIRHVTPGGH